MTSVSGPAVAAAAMTAALTLLLVQSSGGRLRRLHAGHRHRKAPAAKRLPAALGVLRTRPWLAVCMAALAAAALAGPIAAALAAVATTLLARTLAASRSARAKADAQSAASRSIAGLAAELRAGRSPTEALEAVAGTAAESVAGPLRSAARASRLGADPAAALGEQAGEVPAMGQLAACWHVASRTGAGLADVADALAADLRAAQHRRGELAVEVASARASARLLACLPLVGLALGASLGARPLHFLLHTRLGAGVLAVGLLFEVAGLVWTDRLVRQVGQTA